MLIEMLINLGFFFLIETASWKHWEKIQPIHHADSLVIKYVVGTHKDSMVKKTDQVHTPKEVKK